jgi:SAM-dependent MidA family methyltransferase
MKPPTFEEAKEPLAVDAWIKAIEAKFSVFVLPCSEERQDSFASLQLRGEALLWWEHYKSMISEEHQVTWAKFQRAFKEHHIPKDLMDRKMKELLALKQGTNTV